MGRRVEVNQSTGSVLHHHQHVEDSEGRGHHDAEVTRDDPPSVILWKIRPSLVASWLTIRRRRLRKVLHDCPWRNTQTEFQLAARLPIRSSPQEGFSRAILRIKR